MTAHHVLIHLLVPVRSPVFHAVLFCESLDLAVAEHRQPGHGDHHHGHAEVLVALAELLDRGVARRGCS